MLPMSFNPGKISTYIFYLLLPILAVILPLVFVTLDWAIMPRITMTRAQLFELFGFCMWAVLTVNAYREIRSHPGLSLKKGIIVLLPFLVSFSFLVLISESYTPSWDYEQYENAFRSIVEGGNPYTSTRYLYPPPFAQGMASLHRLGGRFLSNEEINLWLFVYYIHQCLQFFLVNLAYWLSCRFASRADLPRLQGILLVSALFVFNYPLFRTLHLNQVNLYVLNAVLIAALVLSRFPFLSGAAVAMGGLIKLYPFALAVPILGMRKWRAILGMLTGVGLVIFIQTNFGRDLSLWKQFVSFYLSFPVERESSLWLRNSSTLSFVRNLVHFSGLPEGIILPLFILAALVVLAWMSVRFLQREKIFRTLEPGVVADTYRNFGHLLDFSVLTLLIAPSAWDHHFVIAIPLALWVIALQGRDKPGWVGIGVASIFFLPAFNVFPFSYLRLLGVVLLLWLASPSIRFQVSVSRYHDVAPDT
ncbi:MAG: DUF2029 domain-containing protein [Chloroflexi bacterium]|nr:MAG: DUF2029 domain-containing protein [Chloroflexota bacterium]